MPGYGLAQTSTSKARIPPLPTSKGLCENCLTFGEVVRFPIGQRRGPVDHPNYDNLTICSECQRCLMEHDLRGLGMRYRNTRPGLTDDVTEAMDAAKKILAS